MKIHLLLHVLISLSKFAWQSCKNKKGTQHALLRTIDCHTLAIESVAMALQKGHCHSALKMPLPIFFTTYTKNIYWTQSLMIEMKKRGETFLGSVCLDQEYGIAQCIII